MLQTAGLVAIYVDADDHETHRLTPSVSGSGVCLRWEPMQMLVP
jgi:hypothetical protein